VGLTSRKRSGKSFAGSRLNVPGQGIYTVKNTDGDKLDIKQQLDRTPRPSQTPTPSVTPTITPTPTPTQTIPITPTPTPTPTPSQTPEQLLNAIITEEPNVYIEPGFNEYLIYVDPPI
jgi:hypothetical protein